MTKRVIDLRTDEEKAGDLEARKMWENTRPTMTDAFVKATEAFANARNAILAESLTGCPRCNNPADDEGTCPFQMDINGDDIPCKCCALCRFECSEEQWV